MIEVGAVGVVDVIGAASIVISETALKSLAERLGSETRTRRRRLMDPRSVIIRPVVSEKSYALMAAGKYTFRVDDRAHKSEIAHAVEKVFGVEVVKVRTSKVRSKPKRRGITKAAAGPGRKRSLNSPPATASSCSKARRRGLGDSRCLNAKQNRPAPGAASRRTRCGSS